MADREVSATVTPGGRPYGVTLMAELFRSWDRTRCTFDWTRRQRTPQIKRIGEELPGMVMLPDKHF